MYSICGTSSFGLSQGRPLTVLRSMQKGERLWKRTPPQVIHLVLGVPSCSDSSRCHGEVKAAAEVTIGMHACMHASSRDISICEPETVTYIFSVLKLPPHAGSQPMLPTLVAVPGRSKQQFMLLPPPLDRADPLAIVDLGKAAEVDTCLRNTLEVLCHMASSRQLPQATFKPSTMQCNC